MPTSDATTSDGPTVLSGASSVDTVSIVPVRYGFGCSTPEGIAHARLNIPPYLDGRGKFRIASLFYETFPYDMSDSDIYTPVWTLKSREVALDPSSVFYQRVQVLPSLYKLYIETNDPTEYDFAIAAFGPEGWEHWQVILRNKIVLEYVEEWRKELKVKLESEALRAARRMAKSEVGSVGLQAVKWLHNALQAKNQKGRPSKAQIEAEAKKMAREQEDFSNDAERLGL